MFWPLVIVSLVSIWAVLTQIDLTPRVGSDFFFASDDPALQVSDRIDEQFGADESGEQLFISASGEDIVGRAYLERMRELTEEIEAIEGVSSVQSLTSVPARPEQIPDSPLWSRLLLSPDNPNVSFLVATVEADSDSSLVQALDAVVDRLDRPSFDLEISGAPYVVELIRRQLTRDLRIFSLAAFAVFGLLIAALYRDPWIVVGTLATAVSACAVTISILAMVGVPIGVLTANIVTIVFVLTLSHLVFLTSNARRAESPGAVVETALGLTARASFWAATTTLLGFLSLRLASAQPLRELAISGAIGTAVALILAYGLYPAVLHRVRDKLAMGDQATHRSPSAPAAWPLAAAIALTVVAAFGLSRIETDPSLLEFFAKGDEIREGIAFIDANGGSSPLSVVVEDSGNRFDETSMRRKLEALQTAYDQDPAVGSSLSLPVLLAEARRVPLAAFFDDQRLIALLESAQFDGIARSFVDEDRTAARFLLRMREADRSESRQAIIDRLATLARDADLEPTMIGGIYDLQAQLGALVASSLVRGLSALIVLFVLIAFWVSRSIRSTLAMLMTLAAVPVLLLGTMGFTGTPVDFISSPAANVAIALGIDAMIHLSAAVCRRRSQGSSLATAWRQARRDLSRPILAAMLILAGGFGIFALSSFPPTQRFGLAVAGGTLAAALLALYVLPVAAGGTRQTATKVAGTLALVSMLGCTASPSIDQQSSPLTVALHSDPLSLDPHRYNEVLTFSVLSNIYEGLTGIGPNGRVLPVLAERWENPDDVTWRFVLRSNAVFHDGRPLTADDVVASLERARTHPETEFSSYLVEIDQIRALDPTTVEITTARPYPILLNKLAFVMVVPADAPIEIDEPIGTGPYRLVDYVPDEQARLDAFTGYWLEPAPEPQVTLLTLPDPRERLEQLLAGTLDLATELAPGDLGAIDRSTCCRVASRDGLQVEYIAMRIAAPPFDDRRVREAIHLAIDRQALVERQFGGHATPATQMVGPNVFGFAPDLPVSSADPAQARQLLEDAGYENGIDLVLEHRVGRDPTLVVEQLAAVGIRITATAYDWSDMIERLRGGTTELYFGGVLAVSADASDVFDSIVHSRDRERGYGQNNWSGLNDSELDRLIEDSGTTLDMMQRRRTLEAAMTRLMSELVYLPLFYQHEIFGAHQDLVFEPRLDGMLRLRDMYRQPS